MSQAIHKTAENREHACLPANIKIPRIPQYFGGKLTNDVRIATAASVKKKFQ